MTLYDLSGTVTGSGDSNAFLAVHFGVTGTITGSGSSSAPLHEDHDLNETLGGSSSITGSIGRVLLFSGQPSGFGDVLDGTLLPLSGQATGSGSLAGSLVRRTSISGGIVGQGRTFLSYPDPIFGIAIVTAYMDVVHVPRPCPVPEPTTFRWMQRFQRGDLGICISDGVGGHIGLDCCNITYTLYQLVKGCVLHQVGPSGRRPASSGVGNYYVTGFAGDGGQPGLWTVRWQFRLNVDSPIIEKDMCFKVVDSVLGKIPGDTTQRVCKYGWDPGS